VLIVLASCAPAVPTGPATRVALGSPVAPPAAVAPTTPIAAGVSPAQPDAAAPDRLAAQIDARFQEFDRPDGPGCAVGVSRRGETLLVRGYGMANLEHGIRNRGDTVFYVASVAKQVTGLAVALLVHDGALAVDDDVRRYVPELPDYGSPIRIEHLLHQTSGIRDYSTLSFYASMRSADLLTTGDALRLIGGQHQLNFAPGARFAYSNSNYFLLARIVETVSGKPFRELAQQRIFQPLGMTHSLFREDHASVIPGRATGYVKTARGLRTADLNADGVGAGGLYSSVEDLLRWATQFTDGRLGGADVLRAQVTSGKLSSGADMGYGYGLYIGPLLGRPMFEHSGGVSGYAADFLFEPATQLAVAVLCNTSADAPQLALDVAGIYLGDPPATAPAAPVAPGVAPAEDVAPFAGIFWNRDSGAVIWLEAAAGALRLRSGGGPVRELHALGGGRFRLADQPVGFAFLPPKRGQSPGLTRQQDGKPATTWERAAPPSVTPAALVRYAGTYRNDALGVSWSFIVTADHLVLDRPRQDRVTLIPVFRDAFVDEPDGDLIRFDGQRWLVTNSRIHELTFVRAR